MLDINVTFFFLSEIRKKQIACVFFLKRWPNEYFKIVPLKTNVNILDILKCGDLTETNLKMSLNLYKIYYSGSISNAIRQIRGYLHLHLYPHTHTYMKIDCFEIKEEK